MAFEDIIGHDRQKRFLKFFLENKNIPHAFLFCGQEGIGKSKIALEFAAISFLRYRQCVRNMPAMPQNLTGEAIPTLLSLQNEGSIGIDDSRMISKEIIRTPLRKRKKGHNNR